MGLTAGCGRFLGEGNCNPVQYSCLEKSLGQRSLESYSPWASKESDRTERPTVHTTSVSTVYFLQHRCCFCLCDYLINVCPQEPRTMSILAELPYCQNSPRCPINLWIKIYMKVTNTWLLLKTQNRSFNSECLKWSLWDIRHPHPSPTVAPTRSKNLSSLPFS